MRDATYSDFAHQNVADIISMQRGPDMLSFEAERLKELTTGRIRAITGTSCFGMLVTKLPLTKEEQAERDALLYSAERNAPHFARHYWRAVEAIWRIYGYDLKTETGSAPKEAHND